MYLKERESFVLSVYQCARRCSFVFDLVPRRLAVAEIIYGGNLEILRLFVMNGSHRIVHRYVIT